MKNVKAWLLILLTVFIIDCFSQQTVQASEKIYDQAEIFSPEKRSDIEEAIGKFEKSSGMAAIVVTNNTFTDKSAMEYADDFYDQHGFGTGSDKSGILFLIDLSTRDYWISTSGKAIKLFKDANIEHLLDKGESAMGDGNYANAIIQMLKAATAHSDNYTYNDAENRYQRVRRILWYEGLIAGLVALMSASGFFVSIQRKYNLKKQPYAYPFREEGTIDLTNKEDTLIHTATASRYIPPANSNNRGGGGGSTHTSSGGATHGGGGRSF